jgi:DNA-binding GntR family transcriptional regulator
MYRARYVIMENGVNSVRILTMNSTRNITRPPPLPGRQMLADSVYEAVKEQVMNRTIPPGTRINIDQLARELQVSNTPLREALTRLETEGLVTRRNLRGFWTADLLDERGIRNYYAVRLLLEPSAAEEAARSPELETLTADLQMVIDQMRQSAQLPTLDHDYQRYRDFAAADARFHGAIAAASGNAVLAGILAGMNAHVHNYRLYFRGGMAGATVTEHQAVLDALSARNSAGAAAALYAHLEHARDRLLPIAASSDDAE